MEKRYIRRILKVNNYYDIMEQFTNETFYTHFRMSRNAFLKLEQEVESYWKLNKGHPCTSVRESLYITIWALANQNSFRELGDRFDKSKSSAYTIVMKTCRILNKLSQKYIKWPRALQEIEETVQKFQNLRRRGFPNVVGCIDGMHVAIKTPSADASSYYNRKGFHSMILQAVCKSDGSFSNIFFGWPGRSHDACVFENSEICKRLNSGQIYLPEDVHIIGDSAYPLSLFLMTPYKDNGNLTEHQKIYNRELSSTRVIIEQAFRRLKCKFQILKNLNFITISRIKDIVLACVVLHNFIILEDNETISTDEILDFDSDTGNLQARQSISNTRALTKRDLLCQLINS